MVSEKYEFQLKITSKTPKTLFLLPVHCSRNEGGGIIAIDPSKQTGSFASLIRL
jgi:hypothetical protein